MASAARPGFASFATLQMPSGPPGPYQTVGTLLKIAGWVRLAMLALTVLVGLIAVFFLAVAGTVGGLAANFLLGPWGALGGVAAGVIVVFLFLVLAFTVAVHAAFTWWTSWLYAKWVAKDPAAVQHLFIYGLVTTVLAGIGVLGMVGGNPGGIIDLGLLVIGIMLLVQSQSPEVKQMAVPAAPQGAAPQGWRPVDEPREP